MAKTTTTSKVKKTKAVVAKPAKKVAAKSPAKAKLVAKKAVKTVKSAKPIKAEAAKKPVAKKAVKAVAVKKAVKAAVAKPVAPKKAPRPQKPAGFPEQVRDAALKVLDDRQAEDIITIDLAGRSTIADYLIIASGRAARQLGAIAHYLREAFEKLGLRNIRVEGMSDANWVLVDSGDVIIHLFRPEVRDYYHLEDIWTDKVND